MNINAPFAAQAYAAARPATEAKPNSNSASDSLSQTVTDFVTTLKDSEKIATNAMTGTADPHSLVQALAQTELAVETAVTVRNKVVEAYQEILRMPV
ncbi:flagellar hook-basal body protein FliE [Shimia thalassica]|uniref:Flagellar hook-basal body complex protein FliE n=1 Tax=Shimia thalassica TaxID=1715693 RepID=A0A0P1IH15_9RHOB|nr:flagellar hook-basal body complex protein FliE [Shimia thalassica]CUK12722.1 flagellar hook-basal body protein FliE [Shimia thalassica]